MSAREAVLIASCLLLGACAHPIVITPKEEVLAKSDAKPSPRSVAYVIAQADRDREVTTDGGGGDKVSYFPYRDLEAGFFHALSPLYARVTLVRSPDDKAVLDKNEVSLLFLPKLTTTSSSSGVFTWPPTAFSVSIEYTVQDAAGKEVYKNLLVGNGNATFDEFKTELGLAGRRAAEEALKKFQEQVGGAAALR
jgi:hypothetical protein